MKDVSSAIYNIRKIDELGEMNTPIHNINGVVKILVTLMYIIRVLSIRNFNTKGVIVVLSYPIVIFIFGKIPIKFIITKLIFVIPVVIGISAINLIIDFSYNQVIISTLLLFKCVFSLIGGLLLIVVTGMDNLTKSLKKLKVPKVVVIQLLMLYRYIILMLDEANRIKAAYELRSGKGAVIEMKYFGSIIGSMLLKSIYRAENVYEAMKLRGFEGDIHIEKGEKLKIQDWSYLMIWVGIFFFFK